MRSYFRNTTIGDDVEIVVEYTCSGGEAATYDDPGCGPEVEVIDSWLLADESVKPRAPRLELSDADRQRIENEIAEDPPEDDGPDPDDDALIWGDDR